MHGYVDLNIAQGDIISFPADVIALKYAQGPHGADRTVAQRLVGVGVPPATLQPSEGDYCYTATQGSVAAPYALFVGMKPLYALDYPDMRKFGDQVLAVLATVEPSTRHVAMTIHGPGFGLDESEALLAEVEGLLDAIRAARMPTTLEHITIVDRNGERVARMQSALANRLERASFAVRFGDGAGAGYRIDILSVRGITSSTAEAAVDSQQFEAGAAERAHAFIAMSYSVQLDDVFYFGIQRPVHAAGLLCERMDKEVFTGEIVERIKHKIETAAVVIAELSGKNPNVYLEVGYAWGRGRPTILVAPKIEELAFDVRGHRCLVYESIRNLEGLLNHELQEFKAKKVI